MSKRCDQALRKALLKKGLFSQDAIDELLKEASLAKESLSSLLARKNLLSREDCLKILCSEFGLRPVNLKEFTVDKEVIKKISTRIVFYYSFLPLKLEKRTLTIAVSFPFDIKTQDDIRTHLGYNIEMMLAHEDDISESLKKYYGLGADTLDRISAPQEDVSVKEDIENIEELAEDASVIKLVNQIIFEAYRKRATDIHIEPYRQEVSIRYRIDGILYDANVSPEVKRFILPIISRIKIMCNLNIVEKRLPQDGRAIVKTQEQTLDLRISTMPTPFGESLVIRILPTKMLFDLEKLGLSARSLAVLEKLISKPNGIVFITGPTGSGKTTTLYACLNTLNTRDRKIVTIEDPIEYELKGITQIQVMPEIGLTFARGLRSILRHDPDVIMVGEVRDLETAEIAIRVALTGHLVFSTLHTKDAPSGTTRLIDIGIEPYLVASSIEAFIAQRLIRVICPMCKCEDKDVPSNLKQRIAYDLGLPSPKKLIIFKGKGCDNCNFTGFLGRTGLYEILLVDEAIRDLIIRRVSSEELKKAAIARGMYNLKQDGWQKVLEGVTTPSEVLRVISSDMDEGYRERIEFSSYQRKNGLADKRIFMRLDGRIRIFYKIIKSEDEELVKKQKRHKLSSTKNISAGGIAFNASEAIPVNSILEIKMEFPDDKGPIECLAKVVWIKFIEESEEYEAGICFLDLTGNERTRMNSFVREEIEG